MQVNALIFAAGLGSRLKPLTNSVPKALVEVGGMPLLEIALRKMGKAGIQKVVVNIHHHAEKVRGFLSTFRCERMEVVISDEQDCLLDTGGGLLKAEPLFDAGAHVLLCNVDVITTADLNAFLNFHFQQRNPVSLMIKKRQASRYLLFDEKMHLAGWRHGSSGEEQLLRPGVPLTPFGFQGMHIISSEIFPFLDKEGAGAFPITPFYLKIAREMPVAGYLCNDADWIDIGTPKKLARARAFVERVGLKEII